MSNPAPENETARVAVVEDYQRSQATPDQSYDDIITLAAEISGCPVGMINLISDTNAWLLAKYGLVPDRPYLPKQAVCSVTIYRNDVLMVPDLSKDERFCNLPTVTGEPHFRFYCGMPFINSEGYALGTICVFDFEPRELTAEQLEGLRCLARQTMANLELRRKLIELEEVHDELRQLQQGLASEKAKSDELLRNILPAKISGELKQNKKVEPKFFDSVTIMFTDFEGFTRFSESMEPRDLIDDLNQHFSAFDEIIDRHGLEKLKTIGDAYMCAGGLPEESRTHAVDACLAALEIRDYMAQANRQREKLHLAPWELRIGIHTGPVMAGVVGTKKFTYDIWGDAVNIASRMESTGVAGGIVLSESTYFWVKDAFECESRGPVEAKNKGPLDTYLLNRLKP